MPPPIRILLNVYGHERSFSTFFSLSLKVLLAMPILRQSLPDKMPRTKARSFLLSRLIAVSIRFFRAFISELSLTAALLL
jgi:hypothetical protein